LKGQFSEKGVAARIKKSLREPQKNKIYSGLCPADPFLMADKGIRWKKRFHNFSKTLAQMRIFIRAGNLNKMEAQGMIKSFEYTYELAWNTMKNYDEIRII